MPSPPKEYNLVQQIISAKSHIWLFNLDISKRCITFAGQLEKNHSFIRLTTLV
ncbi:hypothetical protein HMPREF1869_01310 [Bacteroidales bacterium KA00251]|nr:hypothetical protein HMPREF1869_01310 [Bacteroidales bacterium KA00251]